MSPQPTPQMPAASPLLPLLARLLQLIPTLLGLRPVLLRPPPTAPGFSPLAHPPPPLALRRIAFVVSLSNHTRLRRRPGHRPPASCLAPAMPGPTRIHSSCPDSPQPSPESTPPRPTRLSGVFSRNPVFVPGPTFDGTQTAPPQPKSFLEKTLIARESAHSVPRTAPGLAPETGRPSALPLRRCPARLSACPPKSPSANSSSTTSSPNAPAACAPRCVASCAAVTASCALSTESRSR